MCDVQDTWCDSSVVTCSLCDPCVRYDQHFLLYRIETTFYYFPDLSIRRGSPVDAINIIDMSTYPVKLLSYHLQLG